MLAPGKLYHDTVVRIDALFVDQDGVAVDPDTVVIKTISRYSSEKTYTYGTDTNVVKLATGEYAADITPDTPGTWRYRWETTGTGKTLRSEGDFIVQDSPFFNWNTVWDYCA